MKGMSMRLYQKKKQRNQSHMTIYAHPAHKNQTYVAYYKAISMLVKHGKKSGTGLIPNAECYRILGWLYHLNRKESFNFLNELQELGLCTIIPYHGIKIINEEKKKTKGIT
jgi:hypothetical protein